MTQAYTNQAATVNQPADATLSEEPEIQIVVFKIVRSARAVCKVPLWIDGEVVTPKCDDPAAFEAAYRRFFQARYDNSPEVKKMIDKILADHRAEEGTQQ
ncbi:hypothetical protein CCAX7_000600 [Capsulimonas corticalis]|uniref:Uncharacterized protein n=1 Tax=Capsulimonas corticalis TaxID=2219043 RepID=A0A402CRE2_9BACT|nr:hypothetical protein [Capsulimonas corticalis]BDI28009.1 hypothetical protein CCAX7_000600 [Capsulimonas corticalis]